ncbi:facilitated trehalose transporter Tret1-like isoform X2 [Bicyclus anynana]|nr:facilitated trehalose transporter Tret1-like isoform X2 [Bicyclus anynana]XP_052744338.1 facilitated trehalose transporter Tret1-like isoform X2 [Bicyclus anynana]
MKPLSIISEGSQVNQILCAVLISMPMFAYGNCIGWMSPMTILLQSKNSPTSIPLTDVEISWMASLPYLICVPATYLVATLGDRFGRKFALLFMSAVSATIWILKLSSMNIWVFIVARILAGVVMAGSCVTYPTYIKEICEDNIRGALGCWGALFFTTGSLFAYIVGDILSYQTILMVFLAIPIINILVFLMMPESPSYLIKYGKEEEAVKALVWLRCRRQYDLTIQREIDFMKREQRNDELKGKNLMKTILTDKILFRAFQIALVAALARELCGAVPVLNFAADIFRLASGVTGLVLSPNQQAMVLGSVQLCGAIMASGIVERCGRRPLLILTCVASGLSMCILATWFLLYEFNVSPPGWVPVVTLCVCIFCDASGLMPISIVITGETFSYKYRGTVLATTMAISSFADFFQLLFFKPLAKSIGVYVAFYFFGAMCLATSLYVLLIVPETKNRKLEEIYDDLQSKKGKRKIEKHTSTTNVP